MRCEVVDDIYLPVRQQLRQILSREIQPGPRQLLPLRPGRLVGEEAVPEPHQRPVTLQLPHGQEIQVGGHTMELFNHYVLSLGS